jgi:hypothetical protein
MEVESHEEALVEVMVFCKLRPAALEVLLAGAVVPNLHFVWSSSTRLFMKNRFSQFSPIHELGKIPAASAESCGIMRWRCKRKKIFWEKQEKHQEEERLDLGRCQSPLVYSYYQAGGRDDASPERTMMILQQ